MSTQSPSREALSSWVNCAHRLSARASFYIVVLFLVGAIGMATASSDEPEREALALARPKFPVNRANRSDRAWATTTSVPVVKAVASKKVQSKRLSTKTVTSITQHPYVGTAGILTRIMNCESKGNPTAQNIHSSASGLFQVLTGTWGNWGGYHEAYLAPSDVQWAQARALFARSGTSPWNASKACWS